MPNKEKNKQKKPITYATANFNQLASNLKRNLIRRKFNNDKQSKNEDKDNSKVD